MLVRVYPFCLDLLIRGLWDFDEGPFKLSIMRDDYEFDDGHRFWSDIEEKEVSGGNCPKGGWTVKFGSIAVAMNGSVILPLESFRMRNVSFESRKFVLHGCTKVPYVVDSLIFYYELGDVLVKDKQSVFVTWDLRGSVLVFYG